MDRFIGVTVKNEFDKEAAYQLHTRGLTQRQIADELGVSKTKINRWLKDFPDKGDEPRARSQISSMVMNPETVSLDPSTLLGQFQEMLDRHYNGGHAIRLEAEAIHNRAKKRWKELEPLINVSTEDIQAAIEAPILMKDSEGLPYNEPADEWTMMKRRISIVRDLQSLDQQQLNILALVTQVLNASIRVERQASGVDLAQEIAVCMSRLMSLGYTISQ